MSAKNIKIFIASAGEVKTEREKAVLLMEHLNNSHKHLWLKAEWWETGAQRGSQADAGSVQGGIDPILEKSDVILFIFYSRLGQYTLGEFELAKNLNKKVFVYFKKGFSPTNTKEIKAYAKLLKFKEELNETILYDHYDDVDDFYDIFYQHLNQYLSNNYSLDSAEVNLSDANVSLPKEIQTLIRALTEKQEEVEQLKTELSGKPNSDELQKLTIEIEAIKKELSQSEELRQQQAIDKTALEQQLAKQKENDQLKARALDAVEKGDYVAAENLLRESAKDSIANTASTFYELAKVKELQLKYREAFVDFELAAKIASDNSLYLHDAGKMANQLGYSDKALAYFEKSLPFAIAEYGERHPDIAIRFNNLGVVYYNMGEYDKAIKYFEQALDMDKEFYGERHQKIGIRYNNLGLSYGQRKEYDIAIGYFERALDIGKEFYGERHPKIAIRYNNLGLVYQGKEKYDRAIGYYEKALDIDKEFYVENHPQIAIHYNNLGGAYTFKKENDRAIDYYEQALNIDRKVYGENHPKIATRYNNLGMAYYHKGQYDKAIQYFEACLPILKEFLPPTHPHISMTTKSLQMVKEAKAKQG